jgi:hypothetical protein
LREDKKFENLTIVKILNKILPKKAEKSYSENDIERYYSEATQYIEKEKYKKYLYF